MPSFDEALRLILGSVAPLRVERVSLLDAVGRVLAEEVAAPCDIPACDNSAMDGYAVRAADCAGQPVRLKITGYIPAGRLAEHRLEPGCAFKIMTGAPIPPGCDAVVPVEQTEESGGQVRIKAAVQAPAADPLYRRGCGPRRESSGIGNACFIPAAISLLASFGQAFVAVYGRVQVAILSTGDELIELGEPMSEGKIVNSNTLSLAASLREIGAVPVILGIVRDDPGAMREKLVEGFKADALITSAGVSAGDRDFVRDVLQELQVKQLFQQVEMKPGGPTAFGVKDGKAIFSLPGNPVATMIIFEDTGAARSPEIDGAPARPEGAGQGDSAGGGQEKAGESSVSARPPGVVQRQLSGVQLRRSEYGHSEDHAAGRWAGDSSRRCHLV